jgi:hemerythrin-like domain-containing protein
MKNYPLEAIETALYNAVARVVSSDVWDELESNFFNELEDALQDKIADKVADDSHECVGELPF